MIFLDNANHFLDNLDELVGRLKTIKYNEDIDYPSLQNENDILKFIKKDLEENIEAIDEVLEENE